MIEKNVCVVDLNGMTSDANNQAYHFKKQLDNECQDSGSTLKVLTFRDYEGDFKIKFPKFYKMIREKFLINKGDFDEVGRQQNGQRYTFVPLLADWIRYKYLYKNGGIYLDLDQDIVTKGAIKELQSKPNDNLLLVPDLGLNQPTKRKNGWPVFINEDGSASNVDYINNHVLVCSSTQNQVVKHCLSKIEYNFKKIEDKVSDPRFNVGILARLLNQQLWAKNIFIGYDGDPITVLDMEQWNPKYPGLNWDEYKPKVRPYLFHHSANKVTWKSAEGKSFCEAYKVGDFEKLWYK